MICLLWLALVVFTAIFSGLLAPFGYTEQSLLNRLKPPAFLGGPSDHLLGADGLGRDVLSRLFFALRTSILVALLGTGIGAATGTFLGVHPVRIYLRHVLPNIAGVLVVQLTLNFPEIILLETSLSFLGLGIQPPETSLGLALGEGRNYIATAWWIGLPAGVVIFLTTLSISLVGDWVRDALDPSLAQSE